MDILLTRRNIDELPTDAIVLTLFSDEKPLQGETGLLDWRMNGYISREIQRGRITGAPGESILIPGSRKITAKKIFLFGMGETNTLDDKRIRVVSTQIRNTLSAMQQKKFAFVLSRNITNRKTYSSHLRTFFDNFAETMKEEITSIYLRYEWLEEKEAVLPIKSDSLKLFEERAKNA